MDTRSKTGGKYVPKPTPLPWDAKITRSTSSVPPTAKKSPPGSTELYPLNPPVSVPSDSQALSLLPGDMDQTLTIPHDDSPQEPSELLSKFQEPETPDKDPDEDKIPYCLDYSRYGAWMNKNFPDAMEEGHYVL